MGLEFNSDATSPPNHSQGTGPKESVTRRLFRSSRKVAINQGLGILCTFGLQTFLSRISGASGLGAYTLFISWIGIISALTVPGLDGTLVYFLPRLENDSRSRNKVVCLCLFAACAFSAMAAFAVFAMHPLVFLWIGIPPGTRTAFACALVVFSIGKLLDAVFLGMGDAPLMGYFGIVRTLLRIILCLPLLFHPREPWNVVFYAVVVEGCLTVAYRFLKIHKLYPGILTFKQGLPRGLPISGRKILAVTLPMFGIGIIEVVYPFLDKGILGAMVSLDKIGIYRAADSLASLNSVFVYPFIAFWPFISRLYTESRLDELRGAFKSITLVIIAAMLPFSLVLIELSQFGLSLFGREFAVQGQTVLIILALGTMVDSIAGPAGAVLKMTKHSRLSFAINLVWLIAYVGLTIVLTRRFGLLGAALAKASVTILGNGMNILANYLLIDIFPYTIKHALLIAWGGSILVARYLLPIPAMGVAGHFIAAGCEAILFLVLAVPLLRTQVQAYFRGQLPLPGAKVGGEL